MRTQTKAFLRTENKTRLQELRDSLPEEDRMLLVLRVDRGLAWNDLARILSEGDDGAETAGLPGLSDPSIAREAARLRKRFQLVKDRLREMAKREEASSNRRNRPSPVPAGFHIRRRRQLPW